MAFLEISARIDFNVEEAFNQMAAMLFHATIEFNDLEIAKKRAQAQG